MQPSSNSVGRRQQPHRRRSPTKSSSKEKFELQSALTAAEERLRILALELQRSWKEKDESAAEAQSKIDELSHELTKARRTEDEVVLALRVAAALREELQQTRSELATCRSKLQHAADHDAEATEALQSAGRAAEEQDERMEEVKNRCQDILAEMMSKLREERASRVEVETNLATVADEKNRLHLLLEAERSHQKLVTNSPDRDEANEVVVDDERAQTRWEMQDLAAERDLLRKRLDAIEHEKQTAIEEGVAAGISVGLEEAAEAVAAAEQAAMASERAARDAQSKAAAETAALESQLRRRINTLEEQLESVPSVPSSNEEVNSEGGEEGQGGGVEAPKVESAAGGAAQQDEELRDARVQLRNLNEGFARREQALRDEVAMLRAQQVQLMEAHSTAERRLRTTKHYCKEAVQSVAEHLCNVLAELEAPEPLPGSPARGRRGGGIEDLGVIEEVSSPGGSSDGDDGDEGGDLGMSGGSGGSG